MLSRSLGVALVAAGVVLVVASTTIVDVPGPMTPSKAEFVFQFNVPFVALALALGVVGVMLFVRRRAGP